MCNFYNVSRSGYYDWVKRMDRVDKDEAIAEQIKVLQIKADNTLGYRSIKEWFQRMGIQINHKAILRIMNKYGLLSEIRRRRKYQVYIQQLHKYENILDRNFIADKPNSKWVTDITYIQTKQGVLYLCVIKDLYDGFIVAYKMGTSQTVNLVTDTIKSAMEMEKAATGLLLHSDQGCQYTSKEYHGLTKSYDITPSMSRRGNCLDNACVESFFGTLKVECIYRKKIETFEEARLLIDEYIQYYNYERIQLKTKLTPYEKRCQLA